MMNITDQVLAAFQVEYQEHLEGIRTVLARIEGGRDVHPEDVNQAFRLAHSLKGGARVCDLRPIEELGHRLEAVFEQIRNGSLGLNEEVASTIKMVLDAVEDWMTSSGRDDKSAGAKAALDAIEGLPGRPAAQDWEPHTAQAGTATQRLLAAFRAEYPDYLTGLRNLIAPSGDDASHAEDWEEGYSLAHNLRASASAADIESLQTVCADLEVLIRSVCERNGGPDPETRQRLQDCLAEISGELKTLATDVGPEPVTKKNVDGARNASSPKSGDPGPSTVSRAADTVRIGTTSLDALLLSSRQVLTDSLDQDQIGREFDELRRQIVEMRREHESIRHAATASLRRLDGAAELIRVARYFENVDRVVQALDRRSRQICALHKRASRNLQSSARRVEQDVRRTRMVPAETIFQGFRKMVRDLAHEAGKQIEFRVEGFDVRADRMVFQALKDPLIHMLRNCIVHGIESPQCRREAGKNPLGRIELRIETAGNRLTVIVDDDGRGLDRERIYRRAVESGLLPVRERGETPDRELDNLIYQPGFSTSETLTEVAGRGMGLSVVRETVMRLQGDIQVCRKDSPGTQFRITVPLTVSTHRLLLVALDEQAYAIPVHGIERLLRVRCSDCETIEGKPVITFQSRPIPLVDLGVLLGIARGRSGDGRETRQIVVIKAGARRIAVGVDAFVMERDLLIHDLDAYAANNRYLGAILSEDGNAILVLNPSELWEQVRSGVERAVVESGLPRRTKPTPRVLVVDDSFTTRTLEKSILETNGFHVGIAVDGREGLELLQRERFDLVISDVEMPRMDGFALLAAMKQDDRLSSTPVVLVTSRDRGEDREKGLELGADAYIVKQKFDHQSWLNTIREIVGT